MNELIDVVDEDDRAVGRTTRAEMRRLNLWHRAVYVIVQTPAGEVLVHRRTETKDVHPGRWDVTVGGVVAAGEDYETAARRELAEELGVAVARLEPLGPVRYADASTRLRGFAYRAVHDGPVRFQPEEIAEGRFVPLAEADRLIGEAPCCPDGVQVFRAHRGRLAGA
jgi:8-oxo-dGTP pyrophosphatase MutT (NUDIX family)